MSVIELGVHLKKGSFSLDIERQIPLSGLTAIFGPSGAGKSTLLRVLAGFERSGARLVVAGEIWDDGRRFVPPHRRRVATVFQQPRLFAHLNVAGNLGYAARRAGQSGAIKDMVDRFDLGPLLDHRTAMLSGGEAQRVALARALLSAPQLIVMDEPLSALDQSRRAAILPYIEHLRDVARIPILYVSHDIGEVARLATHVLALSGGRALGFGAAAAILSDAATAPALGKTEPGSLIAARVCGHSPDGLCELKFAGGTILTPDRMGAVGANVGLFIQARDVMIATQRPEDLSALNILPAKVTSVEETLGPSVDVILSCGGVPLRARITQRSRVALELTPGRDCFAILKTVALARA